jgi:lipoprotein-anchoring transpeptidase ErfK/SrfK
MNTYSVLKKSLLVVPVCLVSLLSANIQDDRKKMMDADRELYIVHKQNILLKEKLAEEQKKYFNHSRISAYEDLIKEYQAKEVKLQEQKDELVRIQEQKDEQMLALERQIPSLSGDIFVKVDLSEQIMNIYKGDTLIYSWFVSTAADGYATPTGKYKPYHTSKMHFSKQFDNSPMPYSVFFKEGYAIHGTEYVRSLGYKASHGCVRLHPQNAKKLYDLVRKHGYTNTFIKISA